MQYPCVALLCPITLFSIQEAAEGKLFPKNKNISCSPVPFLNMNYPENKIISQLTGSGSIDEIGMDTIQQLAAKYPYFGPAQYLYAKKLKLAGNTDFEKQAQKTALHFTNTYWLHYLLIHDEIKGYLGAEEERIAVTATLQLNINGQTVSDEEQEPVLTAVPDEAEPVVENIALIIEEVQQVTAEKVSGTKNELSKLPPDKKNTEEPETAEQNIIDLEVLKKKDETDFELSEKDADNTENTELAAMNNEPQAVNPRIAEILKEQAAAYKKPVEENETVHNTEEPYYTIDYFASQGIKLEEIKQAHDQFETKVKRFTDWLKQMKRVNPHPSDLGTDPETEQIIENIAASSNETREIVTEAMAEVLIKQGKMNKAIQLYIKLSFLNPDKSTYFAAKIEALKGI